MSNIQDTYIHYNPGKHGDTNALKNITKELYNKICKYGTVYIKEIDDGFNIDVHAFITGGFDYVYLRCGYCKLAYEDRELYNKKKGRDLSKINWQLRKVKVRSVYITPKTTRMDLEILEVGFKFTVEYTHSTKKYFVEAESWY